MDINTVYNLLSEKIYNWAKGIISLLPNFFVALLIILTFSVAAKYVKKITRSLVFKSLGKDTIAKLTANITYLGMICWGIFVALNILNLEKTVTSLLAGAGIVGLALGFAFQDIAANFMSGLFLIFRKPVKVGDIIEVDHYMGIIHSISLRDTEIKTFQGQNVIIPNKDIFQNSIKNYSSFGRRRIDLEVGVSYGDDLEKVKKLTLGTLNKLEFISKENIDFYYTSFGDSSINFVAQFWIDYPEQPGFLKSRSDAIMAIKKAFDENEITIPFPIRTLDFGIKGGKDLSASLQTKELVNINN